jgi:hypothetical protein
MAGGAILKFHYRWISLGVGQMLAILDPPISLQAYD